MYQATREEEVIFIKQLLAEIPVVCPLCKNAPLEHFHKKAKKSNTDYICPSCLERYQVVRMIDEISTIPPSDSPNPKP